MMKRIFAMMLAVAMAVVMFAVIPVTVAADEPTVWSGKANIKWYLDGKAENAEEWHIKTAEDLAGLARLVNASTKSCYSGVYYDADYNVLGYQRTDTAQKTYADTSLCYKPTAGDGSQLVEGYNFEYQEVYLDADIVLNTGNAADWGENPPANVWYPIGGTLPDAATHPSFNGIFQGEGHTISGAYYVSNPAKEVLCVGLFGMVGKNASSQFRNLTVENCYFSANNSVGPLVGRSKGTITVSNCLIRNCVVFGTNSAQQFGGMIGGVYSGGATIDNCGIENVTVTAPRYVGGFIGTSVGQTVSVKNCYITGTITASVVEEIKAADPEAGTPETTLQKYGCEIGIVAGRAAGGSYNVENVLMAVTVNQLGKAENQTGDNLAQAGVIYAGKGNQEFYAPLAIENIYCVKECFNAEAVAGMTEVEGFDPLDEYDFNVVTLDDLTGTSAEATLQKFDFGKIWETSGTGLPRIRFAELLEADLAARAAEGDEDDNSNYNTRPVTPGKTTTEPTTTAAPKANENPGGTGESEKSESSGKKGCGSVIVGMPAVGLIAVLGATMIRKKKDD